MKAKLKYRAFHEDKRWVRVGHHRSFYNAAYGTENGAVGIILGQSSFAKKKWKERGKPICIFVWETDKETGLAFRPNPDSSEGYDEARVSTSTLELYDERGGSTLEEVTTHFEGLPTDRNIADIEQDTSRVATQRESASTEDLSDHLELIGEEEFPEGIAIQRLHYSRERNRQLINKAKDLAMSTFGSLKCQVCDFDFLEKYGQLGSGYIEAHHTLPLSSLSEDGGVTKISDLTLVCSNCHRMLHRRRPWLSMPELKKLLKNG